MIMFRKRRKVFDYPLMEPPFEVKAPEQMTRQEAERQFEWFADQSPTRCALLIRAAVFDGIPEHKLDYSPDSLVPLWRWAIPHFGERHPTPEELEKALDKAPTWVRDANIDMGELTTATRCLCMDIGFYLAEVFMRRNPELHWALWTKKIGPYHKEYIEGFPRPPLVPSDLIAACAWIAIDGNRSDSLLLEKYRHWERKLYS